jgi:hypothetical protein
MLPHHKLLCGASSLYKYVKYKYIQYYLIGISVSVYDTLCDNHNAISVSLFLRELESLVTSYVFLVMLPLHSSLFIIFFVDFLQSSLVFCWFVIDLYQYVLISHRFSLICSLIFINILCYLFLFFINFSSVFILIMHPH